MTDSQELEVVLEDGGDVCANAGTSGEAQQGKAPMVKFGVTRKKKKGIRKIGHRIRDPFNKKKIEKLKQQKTALEAAVKRLSKQLLIMISIHSRGENVKGSVGNLQIDCINNIHDSDSDLGEIQEAIDKLTDAANKLLEELTTENENRIRENAELRLCHERSETKLDELKDLVLQCSSGISQQEISHMQALKDLKDLQEALVTNMPDEQIVSDGISAIRLGLVFDHGYDFLPFQTKLW
ncbi:uncharacterized protein LOC123553158 [Mercenaria mercenaria]|uniref:uncharacterized protein LOC123553158 n=1 Tax=Mercenaria mercenaria TaxID=6596 RepID=UPI00234F9B34|nr:uncharacterized protein LOC123553158 [Mercenaria mercenaria]